MEQPGFHTRRGLPCRPLLEQAGNRLLLEEVEQPRIAEEVGHADQQLLVEQLDFLRVLLEETNIARQAVELMDAHPPFDAAADRVGLVAGKVVAGVGPQQDEHLLQRGGRFPLGPIAIFAAAAGRGGRTGRSLAGSSSAGAT